MRNKGLTLIETVITIALVALIFFLINPLIRSAKRTSRDIESGFEVDYVGVFDSFVDSSSGFFTEDNKIDDGEEGSVLFLEVPSSSTDSDFVFLFFDEDENELVYQRGFNPDEDDPENPIVIMEDVEGNFRYEEGVVIYYIDLILDPEDEGKYRTSLRSSAATRIDIDI